jgi:HK97 family phage major capsid protein
MSVANKAIDDGNLEQAKEVRGQIEALDASFEEEVRVRADMNALKDKAVINIEDKSVPANNGIKKTVPGISAPAEEEKLYRAAFARAMMGQSLDAEEQRVFDLINPGINNVAQTSSDHQVVIPTTLVEEIWKEAAKIHPVLSLISMTNVKGKIEYPKENGTAQMRHGMTKTLRSRTGPLQLPQLNWMAGSWQSAYL